MGQLVRPMVILLGALLFGVPWSGVRGDTPPASSATPDDCDPSRSESISCGTHYFNVAGRVVFAARDGTHIPVRNAKFFEVESLAHGVDAEPRSLRAKTSKSGDFRLQAFVSTSSRSKLCPDGQVQTHAFYATTFLLLRARGCEDLTIRVEKDWTPGIIVMQCPGLP
jgi:hypothetical protein